MFLVDIGYQKNMTMYSLDLEYVTVLLETINTFILEDDDDVTHLFQTPVITSQLAVHNWLFPVWLLQV